MALNFEERSSVLSSALVFLNRAKKENRVAHKSDYTPIPDDFGYFELDSPRVSPPPLERRSSGDLNLVRELGRKLDEVNSFSKRRQTESLFLNKFLTIHKGARETQSSLWTLRGLFRHINRIIDASDSTLDLSVVDEQSKSGKPPIRRRSLSVRSALPPESNTAQSKHVTDSLRRPSLTGNKVSYTDMASIIASNGLPPKINSASDLKALLNARHKALSPFGSSSNNFSSHSNSNFNINSDKYKHNCGINNVNNSNSSIRPMIVTTGRHFHHGGIAERSIKAHVQSRTGNNSNNATTPRHKHSSKQFRPKSTVKHCNLPQCEEIEETLWTPPLSTQRLVFRDLRRLDFQFNSLDREPVLMVRRHCIVFSFYPITAIILADRVLLLVPHTNSSHTNSSHTNSTSSSNDKHRCSPNSVDSTNSSGFFTHSSNSTTASGLAGTNASDSFATCFETYMRDWSHEYERQRRANSSISPVSSEGPTEPSEPAEDRDRDSNSRELTPYEVCALEGLLTIIRSYEEQELAAITRSAEAILRRYYQCGCTPPLAEEVRFKSLKACLGGVRRRVQGYRAALVDAAEDEELMALMNLSQLKTNPQLCSYPLSAEILHMHEHIEETLESYILDFVNIMFQVRELEDYIRNSEETHKIQLDTVENRYLTIQTALEVCKCSMNFGAFLSAVFGMNLDNVETIQTTEHGFVLVCLSSFGFLVLLFSSIMCVFWYFKMFPETVLKEQYIPLFDRSEGSNSGFRGDEDDDDDDDETTHTVDNSVDGIN